MHDLTAALASIGVLVCVVGGTLGILVGSVQLLMGGTWTTLVGSCGLVASGVLMGKWFLNDDEKKG